MSAHQVLSTVVSATSSSVWLLVVFVTAVVLVTMSALLRAPRSDAREVYRAFTAAFGFHGPAAPRAGVDDDEDDAGEEHHPSEESR